MSDGGLVWFRLRWPREVGSDRLQAISLLLASTHGPAVVEAIGNNGSVDYRLAVGRAHAESLVEQLRVVLPGVDLTPLERRSSLDATLSVEVRLSSPNRTLRIEEPELVSRALITALAQARAAEYTVVQWQLLRTFAATSPGAVEHAEEAPRDFLSALVGQRTRPDAESLRAVRAKRSLPTWRCVGRLGVRASSPARSSHLLHQLVRALAVADAPGVRLVVRRANPARIDSVRRPLLAPVRLNSNEIALLAGWPVGAPNGIRTRVAALKGRSPRPLDDGDCAGDITRACTLFGHGKGPELFRKGRKTPGPVAAVVWLWDVLPIPVLPRCTWGRVP